MNRMPASERIALTLFSLTRDGVGLKHLERLWREDLHDRLQHHGVSVLHTVEPEVQAIAHGPAHFTRYFGALKGLTENHESRYLLTGTWDPVMVPGQEHQIHELQLALCLFDAHHSQYAIRQIGPFRLFDEGGDTLEEVAPMEEDWNLSLYQAANWVIQEIEHSVPASAGVSDAEIVAFIPADDEADEARPVELGVAAPAEDDEYGSMKALLEVASESETSVVPKIRALEERLAAAPGNAIELHEELGQLYKNVQAVKTSVYHYKQAFQLAEGNAESQARFANEAGIGCALLNQDDFAIGWWQKALECQPSLLNPYMNIAHTYEEKHEYGLAESYFLKAAEVAPNDVRIPINLARIYSKMGQWDKTITQYQRQLESDPTDPWCHSDIATSYLQMGDMDKAIHHLEQTVALDEAGEAGQYAKLVLMELVASSR